MKQMQSKTLRFICIHMLIFAFSGIPIPMFHSHGTHLDPSKSTSALNHHLEESPAHEHVGVDDDELHVHWFFLEPKNIYGCTISTSVYELDPIGQLSLPKMWDLGIGIVDRSIAFEPAPNVDRSNCLSVRYRDNQGLLGANIARLLI